MEYPVFVLKWQIAKSKFVYISNENTNTCAYFKRQIQIPGVREAPSKLSWTQSRGPDVNDNWIPNFGTILSRSFWKVSWVTFLAIFSSQEYGQFPSLQGSFFERSNVWLLHNVPVPLSAFDSLKFIFWLFDFRTSLCSLEVDTMPVFSFRNMNRSLKNANCEIRPKIHAQKTSTQK